MFKKLFLLTLMIKNSINANYFSNRINHMEFYRNLTRPSKSFTSFSNNYFSQNYIPRPQEKIECGTRTVNFNPRRTPKIVGGSESPYGAFPWQEYQHCCYKAQTSSATVSWSYAQKKEYTVEVVEIEMLNTEKMTFEHHCGGAVVGERLVLSAAHCFDKQPLSLEHVRLVTGEHRLKVRDQHENRFLPERIILHPDFRKICGYDTEVILLTWIRAAQYGESWRSVCPGVHVGPHSNDIALVAVRARGTTGIQFNSHVRPICLPDMSWEIQPGAWCTVSGWGYESESTEDFAPVLRAAAVPVLDLATCRKNQVLGGRQQAILDTMLCAGVLSGGVDACNGDSGGPLACVTSSRWQLAGVVSWGAGCARRRRPGVYTRVASYLPWIRETAASMRLQLPSL